MRKKISSCFTFNFKGYLKYGVISGLGVAQVKTSVTWVSGSFLSKTSGLNMCHIKQLVPCSIGTLGGKGPADEIVIPEVFLSLCKNL